MEVSAETADLVVREGVQLSEEAIKLLASGAKNLAAQFEFQRHGHGFAKFQPGMRVMPYIVVNCLDAGH